MKLHPLECPVKKRDHLDYRDNKKKCCAFYSTGVQRMMVTIQRPSLPFYYFGDIHFIIQTRSFNLL